MGFECIFRSFHWARPLDCPIVLRRCTLDTGRGRCVRAWVYLKGLLSPWGFHLGTWFGVCSQIYGALITSRFIWSLLRHFVEHSHGISLPSFWTGLCTRGPRVSQSSQTSNLKTYILHPKNPESDHLRAKSEHTDTSDQARTPL